MYLTEKEEEQIRINFSLESILWFCKEEGHAFATWRLPNSSDNHLLISFRPQRITKEEIEKLPPGFLVGAFDSVFDKRKFFLPADLHFVYTKETSNELLNQLKEKLPGFGRAVAQRKEHNSPLHNEKAPAFETLVEKAVSEIQKGQVKKIVLARNKTVPLTGDFSLDGLWEKIGEKYTNTFNSLLYLPDQGVWIGATPEVLVSKDAQGIFRTVALAGTQKALDRSEKEAVWTQKEIEEQAYVRRYIIDCLKHIRLREFEDIGPKTIRVGHLFHLRTDFLVDTKEVDFPQLLSTMLDLLHPTAAVCGTPKEESLKFILEQEGFERELYGGFVGPVNISNETHLFVNLRCAKIQGSSAVLFAGAGITEDSVPEKEFAETETKMDSLLSLL